MILRRKGSTTLLSLLLLQLSFITTYSQNARSYDTSEWLPISQPSSCVDCKTEDKHVIEKKAATGKSLHFPQESRSSYSDYRNVRQTNNNYQQYLTEPGAPSKQKHRQNLHQTNQQQQQYEIPRNHQLSPAQLQQAYTAQHLLPNIDLITRQVLQQSQKIAQQIQPPRPVQQQNPNQYNQYIPQQIYNPALIQQNYPAIPQQFVPPQQLQQIPQPQLYQQQNYVQQNYQPIQPQRQELQQIQNSTLYDNSGIQNFNHELLSVADQNYKTIDITSTTPKAEKENVQLLYVPLEHLQQKQQAANRPQSHVKHHRHKQVIQPLKTENLLEGIEQDFIQQALQAHKFQQELDQQSYSSPSASSFVTTPPTTTTLKPVSRKRKPHQPPLAVYMNAPGHPKITDVLNVLKEAKTIDVQDTIGPESPHVFVGPANLDPPEGFSKFDLPYLSNIESNRIERKVDQLPFFVAPLNYKTPVGYSKIPFPSPHVGSVVINNNELEREALLEAVPSVEDFLRPYQDIQPAQLLQSQKAEISTARPAKVEETTPVYYVRRPTRTRGRQQQQQQQQQQQTRIRTHSDVAGEQSIQANPIVNYINNYDTANNKENVRNIYQSPVSSTISPNIPSSTKQPNVEINNPSLNLSHQLNENHYLTANDADIQEQTRQQNRQSTRQRNEQTVPSTLQENKKSHLNYFSDISSVTSTSPVPQVPESTPKFNSNNFEIIPSISTTISPYHEKDAVQNFFQEELANFPRGSSTPPPRFYQQYDASLNNQNQKLTPETMNIFSIIPTGASNQQTTKEDRRYLPLNSQVRVPPPPQIDYDEIFQLPIKTNQQQAGVDSVSQHQSKIKSTPIIQGLTSEGVYKTLEEFPIPSTTATPRFNNQSNRQHAATIAYEESPIRQPTKQRTRGRVQQEPQYISPQSNSNQNSYENPQDSPLSANSALPGLINSLEDPSIRQLLTPILLAPPEKLPKAVSHTTPQPTQTSNVPILYDQISQTIPSINYDYDKFLISTTTEAPSTVRAQTVQVETTTAQKRLRNRGRGSSRYTDRTTTRSPIRNPLKVRTQHPTRNRFRQTTTTTEAYRPVKQHFVTTTIPTTTTTTPAEIPRKIPTRQKFRTRGRPLQTEYYSSAPASKINPILKTTTPQLVINSQEEEQEHSTVKIPQHAFYEDQPIRKPQLITRSKILTPEEEYLVNKYNLQVTTIEDPITENINIQEDVPEQTLDSSKTVQQVQEVYPITASTPLITELETTTKYHPTTRRYLSHKQKIQSNVEKIDHPPVRIRTRIRGRKTTQRPTTTSTTTVRNTYSSESSMEEQEQEFYGFFRKPVFSKPVTTQAPIKVSHDENLLYNNPIILGQPSNVDLYEDEDVEVDNDGVQIFTNNQQSPSTPVHFIGEILPKPTSTEKYYEATFEPLPPADRYISLSTTTTTEENKRKNRIPSRKNINKQEQAIRVNEIQSQEEEVTRRSPPQRTRIRGRTHFKLPQGRTTEKSSGNDNYPQLYLKAKHDRQQYTPQTKDEVEDIKIVSPQTEKSNFQITIDPAYGEEESEDQEPLSSILRPKFVPISSNHWNGDGKPGKRDRVTTSAYETTTEFDEDFETTTRDFATTTEKSKKRGYWKLVKLRKVTDDFEVAESQNVGVVSANSFNDDRKGLIKSNLESEKDDFVNSLYSLFKLTTVKQENETITEAPTTTTESAAPATEGASAEILTTATPLMPAELFETTTAENYQEMYDSNLEDNSDLDDVTINEEDDEWGMGFIETSTSTSTEISQKTEICYKGVCHRSQ